MAGHDHDAMVQNIRRRQESLYRIDAIISAWFEVYSLAHIYGDPLGWINSERLRILARHGALKSPEIDPVFERRVIVVELEMMARSYQKRSALQD